MRTKVSIIDVDLGVSVDDIINQDVVALTSQTRQDLDTAIEVARANQRLKQDRDDKAKEATTALTTALETAYDQLVTTGSPGIPVSIIMGLIAPTITNPSAFVLRMKNFLASKGNPYRLERHKIHGTPHYQFIEFNDQLPAPDAATPAPDHTSD